MKKLLMILLAIALVFSLTACATASDDGGDAAPEKTKLLMGTSADYPPFEFIILNEAGEKEYVGIDLSLSAKLAEDMGLELEVVNMSFDNLMASLQQGDVDIVVAAIEKTEERAKVADFSDAYYTDLPPMILVKAEMAAEYTSLESFDGKTLGAQIATTKADIVTNDIPGATLVTMTTVTDLVNNLVYDKCDAVVLDGAVAMQFAENDENLAVADVALGEAYPYRVLVQKGDPQGLLESMNATIAQVTSDGTMESWIELADTQIDEAVE